MKTGDRFRDYGPDILVVEEGEEVLLSETHPNFGVGATLWRGVGEICWWWWGSPPPPPQTTLSYSPHSSVDIMYTVLYVLCSVGGRL